jgi:trehalose-6-phosphate synthase
MGGLEGTPAQDGESEELSQRIVRGVRFLGIPLSKVEVDLYYNGHCNRTLWPLLHCFQDLSTCARRGSRVPLGAAALRERHRARSLQDDHWWVHDYHLMLLGRELRDQGWAGRMGFFLHTPFPPLELWTLLPTRPTRWPRSSSTTGRVPRPRFAENYVQAATRLLGATWDGRHLRWRDACSGWASFPVGIDLATFVPSPADLVRSRNRAKCWAAWSGTGACSWAWTGSTTRRASPSASGLRRIPAPPPGVAQPRRLPQIAAPAARACAPISSAAGRWSRW